ncbi:MAG: DUF4321 domain-containing protein [Oscillospiraceae bacterium]|nr:DUF4321 domain-containing protein [Oscillospiraceae bacterium]
MKFSKKGFVFAVLIIGALIIGGYVGTHVNSDILAYTVSIGLDTAAPATLDLMIMTISLGFTLDISIAQILCLFAAIVIYAMSSKHID